MASPSTGASAETRGQDGKDRREQNAEMPLEKTRENGWRKVENAWRTVENRDVFSGKFSGVEKPRRKTVGKTLHEKLFFLFSGICRKFVFRKTLNI